MKKQLNLRNPQVLEKILWWITEAPASKLSGPPSDPVFINRIIRNAAVKSSSVSGALAIPGGATGLISAIPDMLVVWRIQSQMISNIAAAYGKEAMLTREQMIWCLFRQMGYGMLKEYIIEKGGTYLVQQASQKVTHKLLEKISHQILKSKGTQLISRAVPLVGSISAGAFTYYDTKRVGRTAIDLYSGDMILLPAHIKE